MELVLVGILEVEVSYSCMLERTQSLKGGGLDMFAFCKLLQGWDDIIAGVQTYQIGVSRRRGILQSDLTSISDARFADEKASAGILCVTFRVWLEFSPQRLSILV